MQLLRIWITCLFITLLGLCLPCSAETVAHVDLRSGLPEPIEYYVVICARDSEPWGAGHTFVVWAQHDRRTGEVHSQGFGFYPEVEKVVVRLFLGNGAIRDESTKSASNKPWLLTHRLIVQLDRDAFEAGLNVKEQWAGSGVDYHLLNRNCTHFAYDVLKAIQPGTPGPELGERPSSYVSRLITLDLGRNQTGLERLPATFVNGTR
jgi:hypothetical protein